jgi:hypothetical protein
MRVNLPDDSFNDSPEYSEDEGGILDDTPNTILNITDGVENHPNNENQEVNSDPKPQVPDNVFAAGPDETGTKKSGKINILSTEPTNAFGEIYGEPEIDSRHWHMQERGDSCAIVSQEFILESFFPNRDFTEAELVEEAINEGYYSPGVGTFPRDVGELLEKHGVDVERSYDNNIHDIIEKLRANKKIIVGVDGNEVWSNSPDELFDLYLSDLFFYPEANHAVEVIGVDTDKQEIILNDPGHPKGKGLRIPIDQFQSAWDDSNCFLMSTVESPSMMTA